MEKKFLQEFKIPFAGMKTKLYQFEYHINGSFFKNYSESTIENCTVEVKLDFHKKESFFLLIFYIDGTVEVPCDRCGSPFNQAVFGDYEVAVKFGDENSPTEDNEDVMFISRNDDFIDVSKLIYEFILLSIPLRCVHPDEEGENACSTEILEQLKHKKQEGIDPRWAVLEKLKNKK